MTRHLLLTDRLPADLHERLENWGRVMRVHAKQGTSITGKICDAMAKRAGQGVHGDEQHHRPELREHDAYVIELVWRAAQYRMVPKRRSLLRVHYVLETFRPLACRTLQLRDRDYENELVAAVADFARLLRLHDVAVASSGTVCA